MGKREVIEVPGLSHGGAPIPVAVKIGNHLFTSAVLGTDISTGSIAEPERQPALAFDNMRRVVEAAGGTVDDIASVHVYLTDYALRPQVNEEWLKMFPDADDRPTRHAIQMPMFGDMIIQLEFTALIG